jgi:adenine phosphoribosyltransferase
MDDLKKLIREVPDYPKAGINFYDITTLLKNAEGLRATTDRFAELFQDLEVDKVIGIESRGFLFGPQLAYRLGAGFVPVRKPGKLPAETVSASYELEYGTDELQMHRDAVTPGERVLIVDDVIATGGTAAATGELVRTCGGIVAGYGFVIELTFLEGQKKLGDVPSLSLVKY